MSNSNNFPICAFTPPPNGHLCIDGKVTYLGQDFRTAARYKEYKDCGFDEILFAGEDKYNGELFGASDLKRMMDLACGAGLKAIVFDERIMSLTVRPKEKIVGELFDTQAKLNAFVADCMSVYVNHPAFYGISIVDEPVTSKYRIVAEITEAVKAYKPNAFVHTCFLPSVQEADHAKKLFGDNVADRWQNYCVYIDKMSANCLGYFGYDAYPFGMWEGKNVVCEAFVQNMAVVAKRCQENNVEFHMTIQSFSSGPNDEVRRCDESDLNWQSNLALGFGCKKIYYYTYWRFTSRRSDTQTSAVIDDSGDRVIYDEAQRNNALIRRVYPHIAGFSYRDSQVLEGRILGSGGKNKCANMLETGDLGLASEHTADSHILVNELCKGKDKIYMLLNLRDPYEKHLNNVTLKLTKPVKELTLLKRGYPMTAVLKNNTLSLNLEPGEAVWILK